jgi:hypothetical protein
LKEIEMQQAPKNMTARAFRALAGNRKARKEMKRHEWVQASMEAIARKRD